MCDVDECQLVINDQQLVTRRPWPLHCECLRHRPRLHCDWHISHTSFTVIDRHWDTPLHCHCLRLRPRLLHLTDRHRGHSEAISHSLFCWLEFLFNVFIVWGSPEVKTRLLDCLKSKRFHWTTITKCIRYCKTNLLPEKTTHKAFILHFRTQTWL